MVRYKDILLDFFNTCLIYLKNKFCKDKKKTKREIMSKSKQIMINVMVVLIIYSFVGYGYVLSTAPPILIADNDTTQYSEDGGTNNPQQYVEDVGEEETKLKSNDDEPSLIEELIYMAVCAISELLFSIVEGGLHMLGMQDIDELIFVKDIPSNYNFLLTLFTEKEIDQVILPLFGVIVAIFLMSIPSLIMKAGYQVAGSKGESEKMAQGYRTFVHIFVAIMLIAFGLWIVNVMFMLNFGFINAMVATLGIDTKDTIDKMYTIFKKINDNSNIDYESVLGITKGFMQVGGNAFLAIVIKGAFLVQTFMLNLIYKIRKYMLVYLIIFYPVTCILYPFENFRTKPFDCIREIASNVFTQAIHCFFYCVLLKFMSIGSLSGIDIIINVYLMTKVTDILRGFLGIATSSNKVAEAFGMAAAFGGLSLLRNTGMGVARKGASLKAGGNGVLNPFKPSNMKKSFSNLSKNPFKLAANTAKGAGQVYAKATIKATGMAIGASLIGTGNASAAMVGIMAGNSVANNITDRIAGSSAINQGTGSTPMNNSQSQIKKSRTYRGHKKPNSTVYEKNQNRTSPNTFTI